MKEENKIPTNSFVMLWVYVRGQFQAPIRHFTFWVYLFLAILGLGALGIYVELYRLLNSPSNWGGLLTAIYTYIPAIAAGAWLQMTLDESDRKYVRSFAAIAWALLVLPAFLHALNVYGEPKVSLGFGILGIIGSTALWWIANGGNQSFQDFDPKDSLGGTAETEPQGDASEYKV